MPALITLELHPPEDTLAFACGLPVLRDVDIDREYGLVLVSPRRRLYVLRVNGDIDRQALLRDPRVKAVHGDTRISTMD